MIARGLEQREVAQMECYGDGTDGSRHTFTVECVDVGATRACPECGAQIRQSRRIKVGHSEKACSKSCCGSRAEVCNCSCGGANHGKSLVSWIYS
jgi:hypothetical protein